MRERGRAADGMTVTGPSPPPLPALAVPDEGRGLPVPAPRRLLEPGADLGRAPRLLPVERPALEDALDRFGHVQPAAAQRRVERHDAVPAQARAAPSAHRGPAPTLSPRSRPSCSAPPAELNV